MEFLNNIYHFLSSSIDGITVEKMIALFWFLFFIEIPRYYILDIIVLLRRWIFRDVRYKKKMLAKIELYTKNPFISIIVPGKNEGKHIYDTPLFRCLQ